MEARRAHNPEVVGSSPTSATTKADTKRCLFFIIYLDSKFGLEPTTRGSKCASIWEKQSGGLFRSECAISVLPPQPPKQTPNGVCFLFSFLVRTYNTWLQMRKHLGETVRGDCFSVLPPQPPRRRLFTPSFSFYRTQAHIHTAHKQAPEIPVSVFYCQREKRIDLTIENMV